jgi:hypothetical protein
MCALNREVFKFDFEKDQFVDKKVIETESDSGSDAGSYHSGDEGRVHRKPTRKMVSSSNV